MDGNQNETYGGETPRTYGEESKLYEGRGAPGNQQNPNQQTYEDQQGSYQQTYGNQQNPYQQTYGNQQNPYQQIYGNQQNLYQQTYGNQQTYNSAPGYGMPYNGAPYGGMPPVQSTVNNIFCYILLVIMPLRIILAFPTLRTVFSYRLGYGSGLSDYMALMSSRPYSILSSLGSLLSIAFIVIVILDIINVYKAGYKITGLILFAIFLNPGYYIWRAYVLRQNKTAPIIYTVAYSMLMLVYAFYAFYLAFSMTLSILG